MEHFTLWFRIVDWFARSSASSGTVEVGKGDIGRLWVFSSNDPFGRLVCIALVGFAADHLAGFVVVRRGCCVGVVVRWLGFGNGCVWRAERSFLLKRSRCPWKPCGVAVRRWLPCVCWRVALGCLGMVLGFLSIV